MKLSAAVPVLVALIVMSSRISFGQDIDFEKEVWPILQSRCADCHSGSEAEARFRVDAKHPFMAGGVSGSVINADEPINSLLLMRLVGSGDLDQMPPDDDPLDDEQIALIRRWLETGAHWPDGIGEDVAVEQHWAYVPPVRPLIPSVSDSEWPLNAIDYFVLEQLEARNWTPSQQASDETLIRRLYLDLVGYPPHNGRRFDVSRRHAPESIRDSCRSSIGVAPIRRSLGATLARSSSLRRFERLSSGPVPRGLGIS